MAASKPSRPELTVPRTSWFLSTMFRMMASVSTGEGPRRAGTPVSTSTPLAPRWRRTSKARREIPVAS